MVRVVMEFSTNISSVSHLGGSKTNHAWSIYFRHCQQYCVCGNSSALLSQCETDIDNAPINVCGYVSIKLYL